MYLNQLFDDLNREALIDLFGLSAVMKVAAALSEKSGKPYVQCLVRKKVVQAKREERVRQLWLHRFVDHYKYLVGRLRVEYPITFSRDASECAVEIALENSEVAALAWLGQVTAPGSAA